MTENGFAALGVRAETVEALAAVGITDPFPIQRMTLQVDGARHPMTAEPGGWWSATAAGQDYGYLVDDALAGAPARRAASITARRSTSVIAEGTQITTRGRLKRLTPTRWRSRRIIRCVTSKSVIAPWRSGRTATM